jgi:phage tail sheath protein FI
MAFSPTNQAPGIYVEEAPGGGAPIAGAGTSTAGFIGVPTKGAADPVELTNFQQFIDEFGDFELTPNGEVKSHNNLAHAVYGFFNNGGTRCYVAKTAAFTDISGAITKLQGIDAIAIVAVPGGGAAAMNALATAASTTKAWFAVLDAVQSATPDATAPKAGITSNDYAAVYYPWLSVSNPKSKDGNGNVTETTTVLVPPSGHIAGVYARVDGERGVHKAPANSVIRGILGLERRIGSIQQGPMNEAQINVIRDFSGNPTIWGARTLANMSDIIQADFKYINVRRLLIYIRSSLENGTGWTVFEPNNQELWAKIKRNVNAFLTDIWRTGALFGSKPEQAFFVRCDESNNPPNARAQGIVNIEIGLAVTKPAEFVVFTISQQ